MDKDDILEKIITLAAPLGVVAGLGEGLLAKALAEDRDGPSAEAEPLGVTALGAVQPRQVVEAAGDVGVVGAERLLVRSPGCACRAARPRRSGPGRGTAPPGC